MVLLVVVALGVPLALTLRDRVDQEVKFNARSQADLVAATANGLLAPRLQPSLDRLVRSTAASVRGRVIVVDRSGSVIADSAGPATRGQSYASRPEVAAALAGRPRQETRHSGTLEADLLATAVPMFDHGAPAGAVRITQSVAAVHSAVWRSIGGLAVIGGIVLLIGLAVGIVISRQVAGPLRRLDETARRVAAGDLTTRAAIEGPAEQRSLARSFNEMTDHLANALRAEQNFVADASHQLRTPLTGVRLRIEEAQAACDDADLASLRNELDAAMREVDRLSGMVEDLLALRRAAEGEVPAERVDLGAAAAAAAERWQPTALQRSIGIETELGPAVGSVWADSSSVDRALDALLENAVRYSPDGSTVQIFAGTDSIAVLDRGPGFAAGEESQVLKRFHRGRAGRSGPAGTGLGLPIAAELIRRWGGEVEVANRPDGGARATIGFAIRAGADLEKSWSVPA